MKLLTARHRSGTDRHACNIFRPSAAKPGRGVVYIRVIVIGMQDLGGQPRGGSDITLSHDGIT